jgi:hypothetical protein
MLKLAKKIAGESGYISNLYYSICLVDSQLPKRNLPSTGAWTLQAASA